MPTIYTVHQDPYDNLYIAIPLDRTAVTAWERSIDKVIQNLPLSRDILAYHSEIPIVGLIVDDVFHDLDYCSKHYPEYLI